MYVRELIKIYSLGGIMNQTAQQSPFQTQQITTRKVSFLLGLGIFIFPLIFSWYTLRSGHTTQSRVISFSWLVLSLLLILIPDNTNTQYQNESVALVSSEEHVQDMPAQEQVQAIQISARELFRHYEANEVAADRTFKGQLIEISGSVQSIESDFSDGANVQFNVGDQFGFESVTASGDSDFDNYAATLSKGQKITLRCIGAGEIIGQPFLDKCEPT